MPSVYPLIVQQMLDIGSSPKRSDASFLKRYDTKAANIVCVMLQLGKLIEPIPLFLLAIFETKNWDLWLGVTFSPSTLRMCFQHDFTKNQL